MIITKTPFRMSFFGGGTDMPSFFQENGGAVLSTTFDKYCYVNVRHLPRFFDYSTELSYSKTERVTDVENIQHPAIRNAMKFLDMHEIRLTYEADLPARSGLGTSSSFAVGMLNAFYALKGKYADKKKLADEAIGEPVYFKTLLSREDAIRRKEQSNSENKEKQQEDEFPQKESETFTLCGYLDRQNDDFPEINQSWHGEGSLYYFISEKGFQKIPTEKKILTMELTANPEKEPYVKTQISELISEENKKRSEMTEVSMDEGTGEAGVFVICKSDLMQQKETYMRGNRILLGAVSIILFIAGLTNYCNVIFTGMYARRKEFDIMKSIGMTDKQMKLMLFGEGSYYFMCVMGMLFTAGMATLVGVKIYMENKLSYFTFHWPIHVMVGVMFSLVLINVMVTHFLSYYPKDI